MVRLLRLAASARRAVLVTAAAIGIAACATVIQMLVAAHIVAVAFATPGAAVTALLGTLLAVMILRASAVGVGEIAAQRLSTHVRSRLRLAVVAGLIAQGRRTAQEPTGALTTTTVDGIEKLDAFYRRFVPQAMATVMIPVVIVAAMAWLDPVSALILALTGPLIPLFMWLLGTAAQQRSREQWAALSLLSGRFLDTLQGLPTLTLFNRAPAAALMLADASEQLRLRTMTVLRVAFLSGFVLELAASISTAMVAVGVSVRLLSGWMSFEPALAVLLLTPEFYLPFRQLGQRHHAGMEGVAAAERIFSIVDAGTNATCTEAPRQLTTTRASSEAPPSVSLVAIGYTYPDNDTATLDDLTLTFTPRTLTAIVGDSGAGKSTLLNVIVRLIEPDTGRLLLDGVDGMALDPGTWRQHFALVSQRPHFIHGTVLDNLRLARPEATLRDVLVATRLAHADEFIRRLPNTYQTIIDDTASSLSGGERQRLAIARALIKGAPVLLLDEPTSSLDAFTESTIVETLTRAREDHTVVVVSHRAEITQAADRVVHLHSGKLSGRHHREVA